MDKSNKKCALPDADRNKYTRLCTIRQAYTGIGVRSSLLMISATALCA
jgi:hypothetical protein